MPLSRNRFISLYMHSTVRGVEKKKKKRGGVGGTGTAEFRFTARRYGSVFGTIHIHTGEGIGVGEFFGLFSVPARRLLSGRARHKRAAKHTRAHTQSKRVDMKREDTEVALCHQQSYIIVCLGSCLIQMQHVSNFFSIVLICNGIALPDHSGVRNSLQCLV